MLIHGKERKFLLTIGAFANISKMCPGGDFRKITEMLNGNDFGSKIEFLAAMAHEMNKAYEVAQKFEDGKHVVDIASVDELQTLSFDQFARLQSEIELAVNEGMRTEVETEAKKKDMEAE